MGYCSKDTPFFYSGQGEVLISVRGDDGNPVGYKSLGKVSSLIIEFTEKTLDHFSSRVPSADRDAVIYLDFRAKALIDLVSLDAANLAWVLRGAVSDITSGSDSVTVEVVTGFSYGLGRVGVSGMVVRNISGGVVYEEDLNYTINTATGLITIMEDQSGAVHPIMDGESLSISFDYVDQKEIVPLVNVRTEYCLRFEGMNTAKDNTPVVLECFRVSSEIVNQLAKISGKVDKVTVPVNVLLDPTKPEGEQFFRELVIM